MGLATDVDPNEFMDGVCGLVKNVDIVADEIPIVVTEGISGKGKGVGGELDDTSNPGDLESSFPVN